MWRIKKVLNVTNEAYMEEIKRYRVSASGGLGSGITVASFLLAAGTFAITYFGFTDIVMIIMFIVTIIFLLFRVIVGFMRLLNYSRWLNLYKDEKDKALKSLKDKSPDDFRIANNLIEEGKTTQLLLEYEEVYKKLKPPHLWNCYLVTEYIVGMGMISLSAVVYAMLKLYILK